MAPEQTQAETVTAPAATAAVVDERVARFRDLLKQDFRPRDDAGEKQIERAIETIITWAQNDTDNTIVSKNVTRTIREIIRRIDHLLARQVNLVIHSPEFLKLEGTWRGLHHLCKNSETDSKLKIQILNISRNELHQVLADYEGTMWDQSPIYRKIYRDRYSMPGGEPFGAIIGDFYFDHSSAGVQLLGNIADICAAAHCPFIGGASPQLFDLDSWQELPDIRDLELKQKGDEYAKWRSLRKSPSSRYVGLCMPRMLGRLPYGEANDKVEGFAFEEDITGRDHHKYCWMNAAYAMGVNINRSFKHYGWCTQIRGLEAGGVATNLFVHTFPTEEGTLAAKCPTEIAIDQRRQGELDKLGLLGLLHWQNTDYAAFVGGQSLNEPIKYDRPEATASANLSARLPYLFAVCRFAHYLNKMVFEKIGLGMERDELERLLTRWINNYVLTGIQAPPQELRAKKPLAGARVVVEADPSNPGYYVATFDLRPHYQLEGVTVALSLVSHVPKSGK